VRSRPVSLRGRSPGRPARHHRRADVRAALLAAARARFTRRAFGEVGIREIAAAAGATPAMIHYYFGDKQGLYVAMLEAAFGPVLAELRQAAAPPAGRGDEALAKLVPLYVTTLARNPWIPRLVIREVLSDRGPFRERFIERLAALVAPLVQDLLRREIAEGRLRADFDPALGALSLAGMLLMPFLAAPVVTRIFDVRLEDAAFLRRFAAHTMRLFFTGAGTRA
jgi:AcrR family transcriptional regulator